MLSDEGVEEESIYSVDGADQSLDEDALSAEEAGFMQGYIRSYEEDEV